MHRLQVLRELSTSPLHEDTISAYDGCHNGQPSKRNVDPEEHIWLNHRAKDTYHATQDNGDVEKGIGYL